MGQTGSCRRWALKGSGRACGGGGRVRVAGELNWSGTGENQEIQAELLTDV